MSRWRRPARTLRSLRRCLFFGSMSKYFPVRYQDNMACNPSFTSGTPRRGALCGDETCAMPVRCPGRNFGIHTCHIKHSTTWTETKHKINVRTRSRQTAFSLDLKRWQQHSLHMRLEDSLTAIESHCYVGKKKPKL